MSAALETIRSTRVFGIVREHNVEHALAASRAAMLGGLTVLEVSLVTPDAPRLIATLRAEAVDGQLLGAGTVLTVTDAEIAHASGAEFAVSPSFSSAVLARCTELKLPYFPGALTPTEVAAVHDAGAEAVKLFPVGAMGDSYLGDLLAPFPSLALLAVGGVTLERGRRYLATGATAIGIGSPLFRCPPGVEPWSSAHRNGITAIAATFAGVSDDAR